MGDVAAVPSDFNYTAIPPAVGGYYSQSKQVPSNGTEFNPGQWIQIPITTGRIGQFYDPKRCYFLFRARQKTYTEVTPPPSTISSETGGLLLERAGAHGFFESVELWLNGQPLEQIQQYNCLMQLMVDQYYGLGRADVCSDIEGVASESPIAIQSTAVVANEYCAIVHNVAGANTGTWPAINTAVAPGLLEGGGVVYNTAASAAVATTLANGLVDVPTTPQVVANAVVPAGDNGARYFAVPILSGLLGTLAQKVFPALVFAPGSLMWQIKLAQNAAPGVRYQRGAAGSMFVPSALAANVAAATSSMCFLSYNAAATYVIDNFSFVSGAVTIQAGVAATVLSAAASGQLDLQTKSFTNVYASVPGNATTANIIIPLRKLSLNSLYTVFRDPTRETGTKGGGFLSRVAPSGCHNNAFSVQYRFGNELIREYPYQYSVEHYVEILRNLHEWMDKELNFTTALRPLRLAVPLVATTFSGSAANYSSYDPRGGFYASPVSSTTYSCNTWTMLLQNCGFFLALDLDVFSGSSTTSRSGRNTTGDQITVNYSNGTAGAGMFGTDAYRADFFGLHDLRINCQAGGIAVPIS